MKLVRIPFICVARALCLMALAVFSSAAKPVDVQWKDVCIFAGPRDVRLTVLGSSREVQGRCVTIAATEMIVDIGNRRQVRLERGSILKIIVPSRGHQFKSHWRNVNSALKFEFENVLTEGGPFVLASVGPTLAWGIAASPFCMLGDLKQRLQGQQEIRVV